MSLAGTALLTAGILLLVLVVVDGFITILSTRGGGPITNAWTRGVWRILIWVHRRRPMHRVLAYVGPAMLAGSVVVWWLMMSAGWFLAFSASPGAIVSSKTNVAANQLERLYFLGATLSSSGYGDFVANGFPWTLLSGLTTTSATLLLTISLSYIIPVVTSGVSRKVLAQQIATIGDDAEEIVLNAWMGPHAGTLNGHISSLLSDIDLVAHRHLVYPVLHYFHSARASESPSRALLILADAVFLARHVVREDHRPSVPLLRAAEQTIDNYTDLARPRLLPVREGERVQLPSGEGLRRAGVPLVGEAERRYALRHYLPLRRRLLALCHEDGWFDLV